MPLSCIKLKVNTYNYFPAYQAANGPLKFPIGWNRKEDIHTAPPEAPHLGP